jgi:hypothetical protein
MIEELKRLIAKATPGPWVAEREQYSNSPAYSYCVRALTEPKKTAVAYTDMNGSRSTKAERDSNAALIAAAVNALPALIAAAEAVQAWAAADSAGRTAAQSDDPAELAAAWRAVQAAEALLHAAAKGLAPQPRRYDRAGCDVTDLPGLWDENDTMKEPQ